MVSKQLSSDVMHLSIELFFVFYPLPPSSVLQISNDSLILRDAWKSVEEMSKEDAMRQYIEGVNASFDRAAETIDVNAWLSGDELDPVIKVGGSSPVASRFFCSPIKHNQIA